MKQIRVFIADDHPMVRTGIRFTLADEPDLFLMGEADDGETLIASVSKSTPDVLLLDVSMPGFDTPVRTVRAFHQQYPDMRILIYTLHNDANLAREMLVAGARGYLTKDESNQTLVQAIRQVAQGQRFLSQKIDDQLFSTPDSLDGAASDEPGLTPREADVLALLGDGVTPEAISSQLEITIGTVRTHIRNIYSKFGFSTMTQAALYAARRKGSDGWDS